MDAFQKEFRGQIRIIIRKRTKAFRLPFTRQPAAVLFSRHDACHSSSAGEHCYDVAGWMCPQR